MPGRNSRTKDWRLKPLLLALTIAISGTIVSVDATAQATHRTLTEQSSTHGTSLPACVKDSNVDSCWSDGVAAEKRQDSAAALANYDRSCEAGFQMGGCYEAGKIYFLDPSHRNYIAAEDRLVQVCDSDDVGIGPYACKYLGIIYRDGLTTKRQPDLAFARLSRSCFLHNDEPFIDGSGCAILAESLPAAREMGVSQAAWPRDYISYLAYAMGCTDDMPALCTKARAIYRQAVATSAGWVKRCVDELERSPFPGTCDTALLPAAGAEFDQRQRLRRVLVRLFRDATKDLPAG